MRVNIISKDKKVLRGVIIENRAYGRLADIFKYLGVKTEFEPGSKEHNLYIEVPKEKDNSEGAALGSSMNDVQATPNFNLQEFQCKGTNCGCNNAVKAHPEVLRRLQMMRDDLDAPIRVNSAFRCPSHNSSVGGGSASRHVVGDAADISADNLKRLGELCEEYFGDGGIGTYDWGYHVDLHTRRRW